MGNGASKEEQLYQAVQNGNSSAVKALRRDGAAIEFVDKEGRTPLMIACTRSDLFDMVLTLLNVGANIKAYQPGTHGGTPLHQAAKLGLDRTVFLLLSRGADPLAVNDDALTPLDLARNRGHISVVRMIEDRISLFSGMLRELAGPGFLEAFAPQWITKKTWVVVVPMESDARKFPKLELVIYSSPKNPLPRTLIPLGRADVDEPKFSLTDPVLVVTDKSTKTKYKFLSDAPGDKAQLERLYKACKGVEQAAAGMPSQAVLQGLSALIRPATQQHQQAPPAAIQEPSFCPFTANSSGANPGKLKQLSETAPSRIGAEEGIRPDEDKRHNMNAKTDTSKLGGWGDNENSPSQNFNGWGSSSEAGPSTLPRTSEEISESLPEEVPAAPYVPIHTQDMFSNVKPSTPPGPPSAPPLPTEHLEQFGGAIHYPPIDTSPVEIDYTAIAQPVEPYESSAKIPVEEKGGQCVVCWDAPAQGVCIPCGHLAGCMECLSEIKAKDWGCPVCRAPIQQVVKVYAV